jgi:anti-sigma B factor antagonist
MDTDAVEPAGNHSALTTRIDLLRPGVPVVHADGRLDPLTAPDLRRLLHEQLDAAPWAIVLDLSALSVLAPGAVPALVQVLRRAARADIGLYLVTADDTVCQALATAGSPELFEIHPTTEAALRALG